MALYAAALAQGHEGVVVGALPLPDPIHTAENLHHQRGLTIAARLVALMRGSITVQSEPGRGSTFAFTARFGRQPHPAEQAPAWPPVLLQGLRVLVVDDNPTNRHILVEWLTGWQMAPLAVGDGLAALGALWDAVSAGRPGIKSIQQRVGTRLLTHPLDH